MVGARTHTHNSIEKNISQVVQARQKKNAILIFVLSLIKSTKNDNTNNTKLVVSLD